MGLVPLSSSLFLCSSAFSFSGAVLLQGYVRTSYLCNMYPMILFALMIIIYTYIDYINNCITLAVMNFTIFKIDTKYSCKRKKQ